VYGTKGEDFWRDEIITRSQSDATSKKTPLLHMGGYKDPGEEDQMLNHLRARQG
jgi:hypothetical protein